MRQPLKSLELYLRRLYIQLLLHVLFKRLRFSSDLTKAAMKINLENNKMIFLMFFVQIHKTVDNNLL